MGADKQVQKQLEFLCHLQPINLTFELSLKCNAQVLDDNCMLCLPNGERLKLKPDTMRMLFEVIDLLAVSPATVSRCGMVYVPLDHLGWR